MGSRIQEEEEACSGKREADFLQKYKQRDHMQPRSLPVSRQAPATGLRCGKTLVYERGLHKSRTGSTPGWNLRLQAGYQGKDWDTGKLAKIPGLTLASTQEQG